MSNTPIELIEQRTANSKTFRMPNGKIGLDIYMGVIHYRDEQGKWQDIDPTIQPDGTVRKAPYELDIDLENISFRCWVKEDGSEFTMGLKDFGEGVLPHQTRPIVKGNRVIWRNVAPSTDIMIVAGRTTISLRRILKSENAPTKARFNKSKSPKSTAQLKVRGWEAQGEQIEVEVSETENELIEQVDTKGKKFPIEIDPTLDLQVSHSYDDRGQRGTIASPGTMRTISEVTLYLYCNA